MDEFSLEDIANEHRQDLGTEFLLYLRFVEQEWSANRPAGTWTFRDPNDKLEVGASLAGAIMDEIRRLVCTKDKAYADVRAKGREITKAGICAVAGAVAVKFGLALAVATSAVAFVALLVLRVGISVFCRLHQPAC